MTRRLVLGVIAWVVAAGMAMGQVAPVPDDYVPPFWPEGRPLEGLVITLDPGHGGSSFSQGYHGSARGVNSRVVEGDLNMRVAALVYHHLKDAGADVHITRRDDRKVTLGPTIRAEELGARPALAESTRSHLFLSLHHNSTGRATAHGVVILIWPTDKAGNDQPLERAFADILREEIQKMVPWGEEFGHYQIEHPLVVDSDLPSAVVEYGFLLNADFDAWVAGPTAHKTEAIATFNAVVRMWTEHREALEQLRDRVLPTPTESAAMPPQDGPFALGRPARTVWGLDRPAETVTELQFALSAWRHTTMTDRTTFYLYARVEERDGAFVLTGYTNLPRLAGGAAEQLSRASARRVANEVKPLPDLPEGVSPFGIVAIPMAMTWSQPRELSGFETQVLYGEPLFVLRQSDAGDYLLVQGIDGYSGWVRRDAVRLIPREEFTQLLTRLSARVVRNTMKDTFRIPPGSRVMVHRRGEETTSVVLADGSTWEMPTENLRLPAAGFPGEVAARTAMREFLYSPYVFAGRSPLGLDCSGFVGAAWAAEGVQLPRDAHQQALVGQLVATPWYLDGLMAGDLLYFIDESGRVIHVALSLGGSYYVHASPPEVQINSLDPADPLYSEGWHRAFAVARRPGQ